MAVASDAIYGSRGPVVVSYVSSNAYYGYVPPPPPFRTELGQQQNGVGAPRLEQQFPNEPATMLRERCIHHHETAMDTDDDGYEYSAAACRLNNHCVIPEATAAANGVRSAMINGRRLEQQQQQQQEASYDYASTLRRRNRKRCSSDLDQARELKKFREGGGNGRVYYGTGCTKDYGLAAVRYQPSPLHLSTTDDNRLERSTMKKDSCCWAAGNHSLISTTSNPDDKSLLLADGSKLNESNAEYESILFETHGCSVYHHYRMQLLDNDCIETEF